MKRILIVLAFLVVAAGVLWFATGGLQRTAQGRIETALAAEGLPQPLAACMGERLAERLSLAQLRRIERAMAGGADEGSQSSASILLVLESVRRIDDPEIIEVVAGSAAICALGGE